MDDDQERIAEAQKTFDDALERAEETLEMRGDNIPADSTPLMKILMSGENDPRMYWEILTELGHVRNTLNQQDSDGMTALMYAAKQGMGDITLELMGSGADRALKNKQGETAADIWKALPLEMFDDDEDTKQHFLDKLEEGLDEEEDEEEVNRGGKRKTRKSKKTQKAKKTRKSKQGKKKTTRRTYALRK